MSTPVIEQPGSSAEFVLLAFEADWRQPPEWSRAWESQIASAVTSRESRNALRAVARHSLTWLVTPATPNEQVRFDDAVRAAKKSGLAATPFWGRGCTLLGAQTGDTIQCRVGWDWTPGDQIFFLNHNGYEIGAVTATEFDDGVWTLTLEDALTGSYRNFCRPLIFGKFTCAEMDALSPRTGPLKLTLSELTNARSMQLGTVAPASGDGIGAWVIEDDFVVT